MVLRFAIETGNDPVAVVDIKPFIKCPAFQGYPGLSRFRGRRFRRDFRIPRGTVEKHHTHKKKKTLYPVFHISSSFI
jgi:hypothetical protein